MTVESERASILKLVIRAGSKYFGEAAEHIETLELPISIASPAFDLVSVPLPECAADLGIGKRPGILVDPCCIVSGAGSQYERCDWLRAAHLHLSGWLERSVEDRSGPIQSYAFRLPAEWSPAYDRAWVNRIYLLLRRIAARKAGVDETSLFGPRPTARFFLTHDVDALSKTTQMRLKKAAMNLITMVRHLASGNVGKAAERIKDAVGYACTNSDYWLFSDVCKAEAQRGFRSIFMFADRTADIGPVAWLIDPSYRVTEPRVTALIRELNRDGWQIGMHPGFNSWNAPRKLQRTRTEIEMALGEPIALCRQHWLRFSWADTWKAQIAAGVGVDFTLGFNDRPGFRNGAAVRYRPWDRTGVCLHDIESLPTLIMDSHFYDYALADDPKAAMVPWIDEVITVGGDASLLWHIHTMHDDFGWSSGYMYLLDLLVERQANVGTVELNG